MPRVLPIAVALVVTISMLCLEAVAQNSNLSAPVSRQPTVATEIDRGQDAGFECGLHYISNFSGFVSCINGEVGTNRQKGSLSEPYEFGLYVRALQHAYVHSVKLQSEGFLPIWRDRLIKIMVAKKLSLADFCKATAAEKCDIATMNEQTYGSGATAAPRGR